MRTLISKLFQRKSIKKLKLTLDDFEKEFDNPSFKIVREIIENTALKSSKEFDNFINTNENLESWVIGHITNISGDLIESGQYHIYRGVLSQFGPGEDLLRLFDQSIDFNLKLGLIENEFAVEQKKQIRLNIKMVG